MLNRLLRETWTQVMTPIARLFLKLGISPDVVTVVGTLGVCVGALAFFPRGSFLPGTIVIVLFIFGDNVDGVMARMSGTQGRWGAFLDSTLDRVGDAAIFGALVLYFAGPGSDYSQLTAGLALACLILGMVVSYAKARAEGLGLTANVG
ncbi:MAG: CDP-alcohol phosphatidyltransferase family protein, partial [Actinomycetota bacterium]|nr:CDP-alcohol phosphatidyltransferase family protein [Actinomycetota bacterium]